MAKKLEGNGLFESSRIILPEHREAIVKYFEDQKRREKIQLDDQEMEYIGITMQQSMKLRIPITIQLYDPLQEVEVSGHIERIDMQLRRFKVDGEWYKLSDVERVYDI